MHHHRARSCEQLQVLAPRRSCPEVQGGLCPHLGTYRSKQSSLDVWEGPGKGLTKVRAPRMLQTQGRRFQQ